MVCTIVKLPRLSSKSKTKSLTMAAKRIYSMDFHCKIFNYVLDGLLNVKTWTSKQEISPQNGVFCMDRQNKSRLTNFEEHGCNSININVDDSWYEWVFLGGHFIDLEMTNGRLRSNPRIQFFFSTNNF